MEDPLRAQRRTQPGAPRQGQGPEGGRGGRPVGDLAVPARGVQAQRAQGRLHPRQGPEAPLRGVLQPAAGGLVVHAQHCVLAGDREVRGAVRAQLQDPVRAGHCVKEGAVQC